MDEAERRPLLGGESRTTGINDGDAIPDTSLGQPPPYEQPAMPAPHYSPHPGPGGVQSTTSSVGTSAVVSASSGVGGRSLIGETPPPYSSVTASQAQNLFVQCRVCQHVIHVSPGSQGRVVKCGHCKEATPVAPPPAGKKYVRCPCNCLLTCSATATRVVCPRENCKRTIGVGTINIHHPGLNTDRIRVVCGRCAKPILWPSNAPVARCPHCRHRSYLYQRWMYNRAVIFLVLGIIFLTITTIVTGVTAALAAKHGGIFVVSVGTFVSAILCFVRAGFYCVMTHSHVQH